MEILVRCCSSHEIAVEPGREVKDTTRKPHSRVEVLASMACAVVLRSFCEMATRERRLAEFNGEGEPPPGQPVQVLCEDHSGTYQLPFACRFVDGAWRNQESGSAVEATVVGWRLLRP
jgi:hypothetical protein